MNARLKEIDLVNYFPSQRGWIIIERPADSFDIRNTVPGTKIRCIDKDFGNTNQGYDSDSVPLAPAWLGAIDGIVPFMDGTPEQRVEKTAQRTRSIGFEIAHHGDYLQGIDGCKFRTALMEGKFEGLPRITRAEYQVLTTKFGIHYTELIRPEERVEPEGFVLNDSDFTTILPDGGRFYPIDIWFARMAGITYRRALPVIEKTGELLLPEGSRRLFIATS